MQKHRFLYIDNLRLLLIIFVVMVHLAVTYSGIGGWYYVEPGQIGAVQTVIFGLFQSFTQSYFMGLLFLIAGYFTPASYDKKGFGKFIKGRLIRLGIPTLLFMLFISPFIMVVLLQQRDFGNGDILTAYIKYLTCFQFIGSSGPLWFAFALLIFSIIYAFFRKFLKPEGKNIDKKFPAPKAIFLLILLICVCTFLVRIIQPIGTNIINMQLCFFSQYIILFIIGIKCKRNGWLEKLDFAQGKIWLLTSLTLGPVTWATFMILGGALDGNPDVFFGGISWQSAIYALWESVISVSMCIGLLSLFKEKCNRQNKLIETMTNNAFSVYVFHAPIIIALSLLFAPVCALPLIKFIIVLFISIPLCFLFTNYTVRKIPPWLSMEKS